MGGGAGWLHTACRVVDGGGGGGVVPVNKVFQLVECWIMGILLYMHSFGKVFRDIPCTLMQVNRSAFPSPFKDPLCTERGFE